MQISKKPNLIFILSDQQRWDTCGCYGQKLPVTPHLDRMAQNGVRFECAFTCQPVCGPARTCLQTGRYASATGCFHNGIPLPPGERTLANWLGEVGYATGYIGKWHLASYRRSLRWERRTEAGCPGRRSRDGNGYHRPVLSAYPAAGARSKLLLSSVLESECLFPVAKLHIKTRKETGLPQQSKRHLIPVV